MIKLRAVARRRWNVLVAGVVLGMLAGLMSSLMAPEKDATVRYRVSQLIVANRMAAQQGNVEQDSLRVTRGTVAQAAAKKLGETNVEGLASQVSATANTDTLSIEVASTDIDPAKAQARTEAFVNSFLEVINADLLSEQERRLGDLQQQVDRAQGDLDAFNAANPNLGSVPSEDPLIEQALQQQRNDLRAQVDSATQQLQAERLNAKATLPYSTLGPDAPKVANSDLLPVPTGVPFRMILLGFLGAVLSVGLVMILERVIPRIDTRDELVDALPIPVLAEVGYFPPRSLPTAEDGTLRIEGGWAEPYRRIRSAIQFVQGETPDSVAAGAAGSGDVARVFMITSPSPSEGKSTTTAVTALAMAEAGERTLVVGGDFRRPSIHKLLGGQMSPGIREHARLDVDRPTLDQIVHPSSHENLFLAPSGAPGKEVVGLADAAKSLIAEAVAEGATVLVDTSPVQVANDAIDLLPVVDRVIVVVRSGSTTQNALMHTVEQLQQHGAEIMGTVLIGTPGMGRQQYYYEGYYSNEPPADGDGKIFPDAPVSPAPRTGSPAGAGSGDLAIAPDKAPLSKPAAAPAAPPSAVPAPTPPAPVPPAVPSPSVPLAPPVAAPTLPPPSPIPQAPDAPAWGARSSGIPRVPPLAPPALPVVNGDNGTNTTNGGVRPPIHRPEADPRAESESAKR